MGRTVDLGYRVILEKIEKLSERSCDFFGGFKSCMYLTYVHTGIHTYIQAYIHTYRHKKGEAGGKGFGQWIVETSPPLDT